MQHRDLMYLGHMLDAAKQVADKVADVDKAAFDSDENLCLALLHLVQIIGESARRVSEETRTLHPQVPWSNIVGMRHKIVHDYFKIDYDLLWDVATKDMPELVVELRKFVPDNPVEGWTP